MGLLDSKEKKAPKAAKDAKVAGGTEAAANGAGRGRKSAFAGKRIYIIAAKTGGKNPCRTGSVRAAHFDLVKEGMPFEDYIKAGGNNFNLKDGVERGYFSVR